MPSEIIWNILLVLYILLIYHLLGSYRSKSLNMNYLQNICHIGICTMQQQVYTFLHGKLYFCCHTFYHRFFELVAVFLNGRRYVYRKGKSESLVAYDIVSFTHLGPMFPSYRNQATGLQWKSIDWFLYDGKM